ncbi:recombinase RecJ [Porphyromonas gingivicanis]|uniref:Single-stranded-DNA-specific exonuclease RecJ n=1 Tax=Porphyromonas gingivicanis TaxID=266762 RepID=A0A0A2G4X6_9PORP|nr:single-stranded-DNA-specific exonuclease RecJ [Porphyromonas gingivicanis]KGN98291.1 recombinase RecJ [Porphyromonas gingivicanis]
MAKKWIWNPPTEEVISTGLSLSSVLRVPPVVGQLLVQRGVTTPEAAKQFFEPKLEDLHDPFLMKDMDKAVERINLALGRREPILVYGDYDVDGTTAVSLVYKFLRLSGCSDHLLHYYIPGRNDDGYGVTYQGINYAHELGVKLIIVLDCGIKAIKEIEYAKRLGIDFIVCDHHTPDDVLPDAVAVLDPKRIDNTYPAEDLSGCGIGFKLMQAFAIDNNIRMRRLYSMLDLVAVSIASDVVSVLGENRILAYHGLKQLNKSPSPGLGSVLKTCMLTSGSITMSDIVFKIGPMINASGRMMNGRQTVDLLVSRDLEEAQEKCAVIESCNNERRKLDQTTTRLAIRIVEEQKLYKLHNVVVVYSKDWHKGVIGIVATRLTERFARPVIVLAGEGELVVGSARSFGGFDMYGAIEYCRDILTNFGGHPYAAGMALSEANVPLFIERIHRYSLEHTTPKPPTNEIEIDAVLSLSEVNKSLHRSIERMGPFGPDNPKPIFMTRFIFDTGKSQTVGKNNEHLKLEVTESPQMLNVRSAIAYGQASNFAYVKSYRPFSICYTLEENCFKGVSSVQMLVKDLKQEETSKGV